MALEKYLEKRKFDKTPEPKGGKSNSDKLVFVVQKHAASHLHYDFRLELRGVLKSWAVPKGPSMDPENHRLAQEVEDHPFDYRNFEGIIPAGQYGGGTVIIWDEGTYEPAEKIKGKKEQEHWLTSHYYKNSLRIILHGKKLKGEFLLVRTRERGENSWLLSKVKDKYASQKDITTKDKSVVSGLTIEQMAKNRDASVWQSNRDETVEKPGKHTKQITPEEDQNDEFPDKVEPMLCTLAREVPDNSGYLFEVKWDGYRIISYVNDGAVRLDSRGGQNYTSKYPLIVEALQNLGHELILDGEVVVFNKQGVPEFDAVQTYNGKRTPIVYSVFDILWLDGHNLMDLPLYERKNLLKALIANNDILRFSESYDDGEALYNTMLEKGWEGVVAKKKDSPYVPGERGNNWIKTPTQKRQEFVIGAWAESDKGRTFRSLLFGAYNQKGELEWIGRSGGGYKEKEMPAILKRLKQLQIEDSPFVNKILDTKGAVIHYVKPELVANFAFATWTKSGRIRKPATFLGFRNDKDPHQVVREIPKEDKPAEEDLLPGQEVPIEKLEDDSIQKQKYLNEDSNWKDLDRIEIDDERELPVGPHSVTVNNLGRMLWKGEGVRKVDLLSYYGQISDYILPYLKDRPLSLYIKHIAPTAAGLYIKDMEGRQPAYAEVFPTIRKHKKKGKRDQINYLVCNNQATLLYAVNLGAIDLNPWSSRTQAPEQPDYITIDLDPSDNDFRKAIETARAAKEVFDKYKLQALVKTSGKTGMHLLLPCGGFNFKDARKAGSYICDLIHRLVPEITTREAAVDRRGAMLFVDDSQNDFADTIASAYSVRPYHLPTVSTPLEWKEVNDQLDPSDFTIHTILERLAKKGDLMKGLFDKKVIASNTTHLHRLLNHPPV